MAPSTEFLDHSLTTSPSTLSSAEDDNTLENCTRTNTGSGNIRTEKDESSRLGSSLVEKAEKGLAIDNDNRLRKCKVYLYRRPLITLLAYHWTLYFDWGDYEAYYEADDVDGYLLPNWSTGKPPNCEEYWQAELGTATVSPSTVNEKARANQFNGRKYILTEINCQVWATELAEALGLPILHRNFVEKVPFVKRLIDRVHESGMFTKRF